MNIKNKLALFFVFVLLFLNIFAWQEVFDLAKAGNLRVDFLDVGQGDSIFIESPQKHQILIDGGPNSLVLQKVARIMGPFDKTIDLVILTHPDKDHIQGLIDVLSRYKIYHVLWTGVAREGPEYQKFIEVLKRQKEKGAKIMTAKQGRKVKAGNITMDILYPFENLSGRYFEKTSNDTSVISRLVFGETSFLFTGDITSKTEKELVAKNINLDSDVLKVPHHGSKYSSSNVFLKSVRPKVAVILVGKNSYGHPTAEVLQRLENFGIEILRTDRDGDIKVISDGKTFNIYKSK